MPTITINDIQYHYVRSDDAGTQPPLVLLHGFTGSSANWQPLQQALSSDRTTIAIDLLGHGETDTPADPARYAMEPAARDLADLLDQIAPGPIDLLGYSMGGRLALYVATAYPNRIRRLILESASPGLADATARQARIASDEALADRIEAEGIAAFVTHWEQVPLFASQSKLSATTRERLRAQRLRNREQGLANSLRGMGTGAQPSLWDALPFFDKPTFLLTGALDTKFCAIAEQMVAQLPQAHHHTMPDVGHTIHLEALVLFHDSVAKFLNRTE